MFIFKGQISITYDNGTMEDSYIPVKVNFPSTAVVACNHTYRDNRILVKATTRKSGTLEQKCSICGDTKNVTIYAVKRVKLSATNYTYNSKVKKPSVTLTDSKGKKLKINTDYNVSYVSGRKNVGSYAVTITLKGRYTGTIKKTFTIKPKGTSISKVSATKKGFTVKWKKQKSQTTGYEIQCSTSSKFKSAKTLKNIKAKVTSKKVTKLKAKKKYYVRIRTYKTATVSLLG